MTVNSTTNRVSYTGNGTANPLAVSFPFQLQADLLVIETLVATGAQTTKAITTDYTITGTTDSSGFYPNGGSVVPVASIAATKTWTIIRDPARTQTTQHVDNDPIPAASIDNPLDKLTMIAQRANDKLTLAITAPDGDPVGSMILPAAAARAGKVLAFDATTGLPTITASTAAQIDATVSAAGGATYTGAQWAVASGTANAITGAFVPAITSLVDGLILGFRAFLVNTSATPTFKADGTTARTITKNGGAPLVAGDIPGGLSECLIRYNAANTRWELLNPKGVDSNGTFAVTDASGASLAMTTTRAGYSKINGIAFCDFTFGYPTNVSGASAVIGGLPFTFANVSGVGGGFPLYYGSAAGFLLGEPVQNTNTFLILTTAGAAVLNSALTGVTLRGQFILPTV